MINRLLTRLCQFAAILLMSGSLVMLSSCDDDSPKAEPVEISFSTGALTIAENSATPLTITVNLSASSNDDESFTVALAGDAVYGNDYTTTPDGAAGPIALDITAGGTFVTFTLTPIDNDVVDGDRTLTLTLGGLSDGLEEGTTTVLTVTIQDDEVPITITDISAVRALFDPANPVTITDDLIIQGVVTTINSATTEQNLFIQDASGAIVLRFDDPHSFPQGQELQVSIQGAEVSDFNDLVQVVNNLPLTNVTDLGAGTLPTPTVVTIDQFNTGDFQAQLVTIENVSFPDADGSEDFFGNNEITDGVSSTDVRVESYAPFVDDELPLGSGNITGVAGVFRGNQQLLPQERADVFADNPVGTINITQAITDFGQLATGNTTASQSYTVSSTTLTSNIKIDAPDNFEVSLDDAAFSSSVDVDFNTSNAGDVTVYIRFAPNAGVSTVHTGDVVHSSAGAAVQSFSVTGEETGATTVLLAEDFDYGSTGGDLTTITMNWEAHSGAGNNVVQYITTSLSMTGYGSSGVGGSVTIADPDASGEDVSRSFASQTAGVVYMAALVNVSSFNATGNDYFFHFRDAGGTFYGRVYAQDDGAGNLNFGLRQSSSSATAYSATNYTYNTTYLLVVKYDLTNGGASLYVLDNAPATEPGAADAVSTDGSVAPSLAQVALRQGSNTPNANVDGIRVAFDWAGVIGL